GTGTQRLSGNITHKGGTTVNGGRLILENTKTGSQSYTTHAELEFNLTTGNQQFQSGTFSGTGKLIKTGLSELILSNWGGAQTVALTGADSVIDVQAGTLSNHSPTPFGAPPTNWTDNKAGLTVALGATFQINNSIAIVDELNGAGTISKSTWDTAVTLTIGVNDGSGNFTGLLAQPVGTALSLVKQGTGTQILSGANTYTGSTTVEGGTLALGANNVLPGSAVSIGNATLDAATFTDALGTLDVTAAATIQLGSGAALTFADSNAVDWTGGTLNITGSFVSGSSVKFATSGGLTSEQLDLISVNGSGAGSATLDSNGYLVLATGDPFAAWAGSGVNFDDDANNDGVDNGLAWLLGADNKEVNATGLLPKATENGGALKLTFTCLKTATRGGALLHLQYSRDLGITDLWSAHQVVVPDAAATVGLVTFTVPSVNPDPELVNLEATIPAGAAAPGTKLFARLKGQK
ncbi:MAG: autotransporter-associated beta strand repeat-containing protein, partial [Luteolibacter sp.]